VRTIHSSDHLEHDPGFEFNRGKLVAAFESPQRAERVLAAIRSARCGPIESPTAFSLDPVLRVHRREYLEFLSEAHAAWRALGRPGEAFPLAWPIRGLRSDRVPASLDGRLSYYSFDISSPIAAGTWKAAKSAADVALTGAACIASGRERAVFGLCRPPGHHSAADYYGGYCFLNNAAIAAQYLRDNGALRVAILDVDYHHGNGTQTIFYSRADVLFASIHADPASDYPYFLGYADETGLGAGEGHNHNFPLQRGADWAVWSRALESACEVIAAYGPDALVVSLGVDTFKADPLSHFQLESQDFLRIGERIARLGTATLFVMEGGYAIDEIGINVVNVLTGYHGC
jgi:acetoin utilization deacetylase AcuC-like enzyme